MAPAGVVDAATDRSDKLLERAGQLAVLKEALADVGRGGRGTVVVVRGEAGVGKTALLRSFCDGVARPQAVLWGTCDPLFTPRPFGPLFAIAESTGGELGPALAQGANPPQVALALARELRSSPPTLLVLEDLHWADEATLDVFTLLVRRAEATPALVVATYRDDALENAHPLRRVLGELATTTAVRRLKLAPLSPEAVGQLAAPLGIDGQELYEKTGGNPFFVVEVLAGETEQNPADGEGRCAGPLHAAQPQCSWAPRGGGGGAPTSRAVAAGGPGGHRGRGRGRVRHRRHAGGGGRRGGLPSRARPSQPGELGRPRQESSVAPSGSGRHIRLGPAPLWTSLAWPTTPRRPGTPTLSSASPSPPQSAPAPMGAHREAAAQYGRVLRSGAGLPIDERADVLERRSHECYLTDQSDEAIAALEEALECRRALATGSGKDAH